MTNVFLGIFVVIMLLVKVPVRIAIRVFNVKNKTVGTIDLVSTIAGVGSLIGMCVCALAEGKVDVGGAVIFILLFGGIALFITGIWVWTTIKEKMMEKRIRTKENKKTRKSKKK